VRLVTVALLASVAATQVGCTSQVVGSASSASQGMEANVAAGLAEANALVTARYPQCDLGPQILNYLATGNNGGDPGLDKLFADHVGAPDPQARALADQWIEACDKQQAEKEAAAASAQAAATAAASAGASRSAAAASEAQEQAAVIATQERSCAAIGGEVDDSMGMCHSTVPGNPSGQPGSECEFAWVGFNRDGTIWQGGLETERDFYPGCFR
jgi:hypothetical protein